MWRWVPMPSYWTWGRRELVALGILPGGRGEGRHGLPAAEGLSGVRRGRNLGHVAVVREWVAARPLPNLWAWSGATECITTNNQDHSMMDGDPGGAEYRDGGALRSVAGQHRRRVSGRGAGGGGPPAARFPERIARLAGEALTLVRGPGLEDHVPDSHHQQARAPRP